MKTCLFLLPGFLLTALNLHAIEVTTADNASTPDDGMISFVEALEQLTDGGTITFNIPGAGPHYLITPDGGYPVIMRNGITINGYSQPGASPNTAGLREPNNAKIRIVLDSRTAVAGAKRTPLNFPGFGDTETAVLGLQDAHAALIRGLAFIGVPGAGSPEDPSVYNIALVKECSGSRVQGCWFGLDPAVTDWTPGANGSVAGVYGAQSAVASFRWDTFNSVGLTFGKSINGAGDQGEGNLCMAQRVAVNLQTPAVVVAGNWFNVFPDGSLLDLEKQGLGLGEDDSLAAIENGDPLGMLIGTDGNGVNDANEGNIFGPMVYDVAAEFWGSGIGIRFTGNSVGVGLDNLPAFRSPATGLVSIRKNSDIQIGSDFDGTNIPAKANHIYGLGAPFISWHGSNNDGDGTAATVHLRGNELIDNFGGIPLAEGAPVSATRIYTPVMADPFDPAVTISASSTTTSLNGIAPVAAAGATGPTIDIYIADAFGLYQNPAAPQGRSYLGSFIQDGEGDTNAAAGAFTFDMTAFGLTAAELGRLTITATYGLINGEAVTTSFSPTLAPATVPPALTGLNITPDAGGVKLEWTGGTGPFLVYSATDTAGPWNLLNTVAGQSLVTPLNGARRFYRLREGAAPR